MSLPSWLCRLTADFWGNRNARTRRSPRSAPRPHSRRLTIERLEDRALPSMYTAASVADLIADIKAANKYGGSNTIVLAAGTTFELTSVDNSMDGHTGLPVIKAGDNLTIQGNGDLLERSTLSGTPAFRLFKLASGGALTLANLTLQNGLAFGSGAAANGGAIYNQGTLVLDSVTVQGNVARGNDGAVGSGFKGNGGNGQDAAGGGIWSNGALTLQNGTLVRNNQALGGSGGEGAPGKWTAGGYGSSGGGNGGSGGSGNGGGIYMAGGTFHAISTTFSGNLARGGNGGSGGFPGWDYGGNGGNGFGGALSVVAGTAVLTSSTLSGDTAQGGYGGEGGGTGLVAASGAGFGGGLDIAAGATVSLDPLTKITDNTADVAPDICGSYTLQV